MSAEKNRPEDTKRIIFNCPEDLKKEFDLYIPHGLRTQVMVSLIEAGLEMLDREGLESLWSLIHKRIRLEKLDA